MSSSQRGSIVKQSQFLQTPFKYAVDQTVPSIQSNDIKQNRELTDDEMARLKSIMGHLFSRKFNFEDDKLIDDSSDSEADDRPNYQEAIFFIEQKSIKQTFFCQKSTAPHKILVYDRRSLCFLSSKNCLRKLAVNITTHAVFEAFIVLVIVASTIALLIEDPSDKDSITDYSKQLGGVQTAFVVIFIAEFVLKVISMGFFVHENSYLRDQWNWIDFIAVIFGILELTPIPSLSLRPLRAFRILRPLKTVKAFPTMRKLVSGIINSIPPLLSALFFMLFVMTQFAILGQSLVGGDYYQRCRIGNETVDGVWPADTSTYKLCSMETFYGYQCPDDMICGTPSMKGLPDSSDHVEKIIDFNYGFTNFNNLLTSLTTIFQVITKSGWVDIMYNLMDAERSWIVCLYFISIIVLGAFFLLQLVVAILSDGLGDYMKVATTQDNIQKVKIAKSIKRQRAQLQGDQLLEFNEKLAEVAIKVTDQNLQQTIEKKKSIKQVLNVSYYNTEDCFISEKPRIIGPKEFSLQITPSKSKDITKQNNLKHSRSTSTQKLVSAEKLGVDSTDETLKLRIIDKKISAEKQIEEGKSNAIRIPERAQNNRVYLYFYHICNSQTFPLLIALLIITNFILLCLDRFPGNKNELQTLQIINDFLTCCFCLEMIIRLLGIGLKEYLSDYFNIVDAFIVCVSIADIIISYSTPGDSRRLLLTGFRSIRILRILKLARSWASFRILLAQVIRSLKDIITFTVIMTIFIIIFMVLGMQIFAYTVFFNKDGEIVATAEEGDPPEVNFENIFNAFVTVFTILIGDNWNNIMYEFQRVHGAGAQAYFIILTIVSNIILLNLLLALLFDNFEIEDEESDEDSDVNSIARLRNFFKSALKKIRMTSEVHEDEAQGNKSEQIAEVKIHKESQEDKFMQKYLEDRKALNFEIQNKNKDSYHAETIRKFLYRKRSSIVSIASNDLKVANNMKNPQKPLLVGKSLFCLGPDNCVRNFCAAIINWRYFESISLFVILVSTINLTIYNPLNDPDSTLTYCNNIIDIVVVALFTIESLLQIVVYGFLINGEKSYIRQGWNIIDFVVVIVSIFSLADPNANQSKIFKSLRFFFRLLRPLRLIQKNPGLKIVVESFINVLPGVVNLTIISFVILIAFAILGVNFFKGQFYSCQMDNIPEELQTDINTVWECLDYGGEWFNTDVNFDNIGQGLKAQFGIMTTSSWYDVYTNALYNNHYYNTPRFQNFNRATIFYFVSSLMITALFLLNMFVGVVLSSFMVENEKLRKTSLLTKQEIDYIDACVMCYKSSPIVGFKVSGNYLKDICHKFVVSKIFEYLTFSFVIINFIVLLLQWYGASETQLKVIEIINKTITVIFTIEMLLKIIGLGSSGYFKSSWNILDFVCTIFSWIDFLVSLLTSSSMVSTFKIIRIFRVFRFIKLIAKFRDQKVIMMTFFNALPELLNVGGVLFLCLYLYAVMGVYLFANVKLQENLNEYANFQSFFYAFLVLFSMSTGESWNDIMEDVARTRSIHFLCEESQTYQEIQDNGIQGCGSPKLAYVYFISFQVFVAFILLNNFIAIIIEAFGRQLDLDEELFQPESVEEFCNHWAKYDPDATGLIPIKDLDNLIMGLVEKEIEIKNYRILNKKKSEESILFNFHKNKYLVQYTMWQLKKDDGTPEYRDLCEKKFLQQQIRRRFKRFKSVLHIPTYNLLKNYNFHDVLFSFIQYTYSQNFAYQHHQRTERIKILKETGQELSAFDKIIPNSQEYFNLSVKDRLEFDELNYTEFSSVVFMLERRNDWVDNKIWHLNQMQSIRRKYRMKFKKILDQCDGALVDSSKVVCGLTIQKHYIRRKKDKAAKQYNNKVIEYGMTPTKDESSSHFQDILLEEIQQTPSGLNVNVNSKVPKKSLQIKSKQPDFNVAQSPIEMKQLNQRDQFTSSLDKLAVLLDINMRSSSESKTSE